jgi:putative transposase
MPKAEAWLGVKGRAAARLLLCHIPLPSSRVTAYNYSMAALRKVTFRMYPNAAQTERLEELLGLHQRVYNAALEERIRAYREAGISLNYHDQAKALTQWRAAVPALAGVNAQSQQNTLKRLERAFQAFFRRVKAGETPGFPRFKPVQRYPGWGYNTHGDGWRLHAGEKMKHGHVRLSGVGMVTLRGKARTHGEVKTAEVLHKAGTWYLSVTIECTPQRDCGAKAAGMDWGLATFATLAETGEQYDSVDNPRFMNKDQRQHLKILQQAVSRKTNKRSHARRKAVKALAAEHGKIANRRKDFLHQTAASLIARYGLIATEQLTVKAMTASGGQYKKGLNRSILDTAPGAFLTTLKSKAEEAGCEWVEIPTRLVKPSQTCHRCGIQRKKPLSERRHVCACGANCSRDENAARVMLNWALANATGQELTEVGSGGCLAVLNHETHVHTAQADWRE